MMSMWKHGLLAILFLTTATPALASYPAAIWAHPEVVTLLPDADSPKQIRIDGYFMVTAVPGKWGFSPVVQGWMLFECPAGKMEQCLLNWKDIVAKVGTCLGFGDMNEMAGTVHPPEQIEAEPDLYPLGLGVVPGFTPCMELDAGIAKLKAEEPPADAGPLPDPDASPDPTDPDAKGVEDDIDPSDAAATTDPDGGLIPPADGENTPDSGKQEESDQAVPAEPDTGESKTQDTGSLDPSLDVNPSGEVLAADLQDNTSGIPSLGSTASGNADDDKTGCESAKGPLQSPWTSLILLLLIAVGVTSTRKNDRTLPRAD